MRNLYIDMIETKDKLTNMQSEISDCCRHNNDLKELENELVVAKKELVETKIQTFGGWKVYGQNM